MKVLLAVLIGSFLQCVDGESCCFNQQIDLEVQNEANALELLIGDDFTLTCFANKTVKSCGADHGIHCTPNPCDPEYGLAMWFCRGKVNITECLGDQIHFGPKTCLQFNSTTEDMEYSDTAVNFTASFTVKSGQEGDTDRYYCVAGTQDDCFKKSRKMYVDVTFQEGASPHNVNISSSPNDTNKHVYIKEGSPLNLTCYGDGYPTPNITWFHNNNTKKWKGHLKSFLGMGTTDAGQYHCKFTNSQGSKNSTILNIKVKSDTPPFWKWWMAAVIGGAVGVLLILIIIIILVWKCRHLPNYENLPSQTSPGDVPTVNINGNGNIVIVTVRKFFNINQNESQPIDNNDTTHERWLIYYHMSDSEEYAQRAKTELETRFPNDVQVTLWEEIQGGCFENLGGSAGLLSRKIQEVDHTMIVRTEEFVKKNEHVFVKALSKIRDDGIKNQTVSNMFILSKVSEEVHSRPECLQSGPNVITISDTNRSFWDQFLHKVSALNRGNSAPVVSPVGPLDGDAIGPRVSFDEPDCPVNAPDHGSFTESSDEGPANGHSLNIEGDGNKVIIA